MKMPVLFVGHGSPMNAIEDNRFSAGWEALGSRLPRPQAILSVSAHWFTAGKSINDSLSPRIVYDMYGFPDALYRVTYPAPGSPRFAWLAKELTGAKTDNTWGLDHGTWSVLRRIYPNADIPVFQLSVDRLASPRESFETGRRLRTLREQGVIILGSGNVVHNLARVNWDMEDGGYPWASEFDGYVRRCILGRDFGGVVDFEQAGKPASLAFTTLDHYAPLLTVLGAAGDEDSITVFNEGCVLGSLSMTSYLFE